MVFFISETIIPRLLTKLKAKNIKDVELVNFDFITKSLQSYPESTDQQEANQQNAVFLLLPI